jgi:SAM-dependent methyltransferase
MQTPAQELLSALSDAPPGRALDLACGSGRHARWLVEKGWDVTAVDLAMPDVPGARCIQADLERHEYRIEPGEWDLIVCWLYWQQDLMPEIAGGLRSCGIAALAGKTSGRFATSVERYLESLFGLYELVSGSDANKCFLVAMRLEEAID